MPTSTAVASHGAEPNAAADVTDIRDGARRPALFAFVRALFAARPGTIERIGQPLDAAGPAAAPPDDPLAYARRTFERASAVAGLGFWQCALPTDTLQWTNGTYDIFGLPRGDTLSREATLRLYDEASLETLHRSRSAAVAAQSSFALDAAITTPAGDERWIRITASVESDGSHPVRLFGFKQDITAERKKLATMQYLAESDALTGLANRGKFQSELATLAATGSGSLLLVDLDGFKQVNDTAGHATGDECLKIVASRIGRAADSARLVARVGGDEFAVLVGPNRGHEEVDDMAWRIVAALEQPVVSGGKLFRLGASVGLAAVTGTATDIYRKADQALYVAKSAGGGTTRWSGRVVTAKPR